MDIPKAATSRTPYLFLMLGVLCLATGSYWGLFVAPAEEYMGKCTSTVNKYHSSIWQNHGWYWGLAFCDPMHFQYATNY